MFYCTHNSKKRSIGLGLEALLNDLFIFLIEHFRKHID